MISSRCDSRVALVIRAVRLHDFDIGVDTIELFDYTTPRSATTLSSSTTLVRERNPAYGLQRYEYCIHVSYLYISVAQILGLVISLLGKILFSASIPNIYIL